MIDAVSVHVIRAIEHVIDHEGVTNGKMVTKRVSIDYVVVRSHLSWILRVNGPIVRVKFIVITELPTDFIRPNI